MILKLHHCPRYENKTLFEITTQLVFLWGLHLNKKHTRAFRMLFFQIIAHVVLTGFPPQNPSVRHPR